MTALIHQYEASAGGSTAVTVTATNVVSASNSLILLTQTGSVYFPSSGSVADGSTGTWNNVWTSSDDNTNQMTMWVCNNPQAATHAVTFTPQGNSNGVSVILMEWSGGPFTFGVGQDQTNGTSSTTQSTQSITPAQLGEVIFAMAWDATQSVAWTSPTNGFTTLTSSNPTFIVFTYLVDSGDSSINCSWTLGSSDTGNTAIVALAPPSVFVPSQGLILALI